MSNYEINTDRSSAVSSFSIRERTTDNIIWSTNDWNEARQMVRHFKQGGGFNGWTPQFMTIKTADLSAI